MLALTGSKRAEPSLLTSWDPRHRPQPVLHTHKAYVVATMCRALYTLSYSELPGKWQAVEWAITALPEPWRSLAGRARAWRTDSTIDQTIVPEVMGFIRWTAAQASTRG